MPKHGLPKSAFNPPISKKPLKRSATNIVIDTNIVISGLFFGGLPRDLLNLVIADEVTAFVTPEIIEEYEHTVERLLQKYPDRFDLASLPLLWDHFTEVSHQTGISLARDADDDKFLACAMDSDASFIVSGDGDLLVIREINDIQIITVREFFEYS